MIMRKLFLLFIVGGLFVGCVKKSQSTEKKGEFNIEYLFEKDGIKVYRFFDNGHYHYFTSKGETIGVQSSGKTSYDDNIQ